MRQPVLKTIRSCSLFDCPCQNSIQFGVTAKPPQLGIATVSSLSMSLEWGGKKAHVLHRTVWSVQYDKYCRDDANVKFFDLTKTWFSDPDLRWRPINTSCWVQCETGPTLLTPLVMLSTSSKSSLPILLALLSSLSLRGVPTCATLANTRPAQRSGSPPTRALCVPHSW